MNMLQRIMSWFAPVPAVRKPCVNCACDPVKGMDVSNDIPKTTASPSVTEFYEKDPGYAKEVYSDYTVDELFTTEKPRKASAMTAPKKPTKKTPPVKKPAPKKKK